MEKRGQFYIIFAVIIIIVVLGLVTTVNYAVKMKSPVKFYDMSADYEAETTNIIDYGVFSPTMTDEQIKAQIKSFSDEFLTYAQEKDPNLQLVYIYGDATGITVDNYAIEGGEIRTASTTTGMEAGGENVESTISIQYGDKTFTRDVEEKMRNFKEVRQDIVNPGGWVEVELAGVIYSFDLKTNEAFYYVVATRSGEEYHVTQEGTTPSV